MKNPISFLTIKDLTLQLHLGWLEAERKHAQMVQIDIKVQFKTPPSACKTDDLKDTFCYDTLIASLKQHLLIRHLHLVEHLTAEIYFFIKQTLKNESIAVRVTKKPTIEDLTGGVSFYYGDEENAWSF